MTDLDELDELYQAETPGDWHIAGTEVKAQRHVIAHTDYWSSAAMIVALHNAYPAMAAELRAAEGVCVLLSRWAGEEMTTLHPDIADALEAWRKARGE